MVFKEVFWKNIFGKVRYFCERLEMGVWEVEEKVESGLSKEKYCIFDR